MLVKFESKSNRVKGLDFHPKRPWLLASLHNGTVQIWDYRMGTLVDKFEEHEGPVRGCAFHSTQPLFVTGGDDTKIRVWNYQQKRCLFVLTGHMDYVRSVAFHTEAPWIVSASDDQTIRIWNWQSRSCVAVLTGHSHYVMCAQFHPKDDLVVSASLDQTIRVWDVSAIRRKNAAPSSSMGYEEGPASPRSGQIDLFGAPEGQVKFILEGHDRGVNWVQFHPHKPMIVSASDDRSVKMWRYNDTRAWETDTFRGHFNNVSSVMFHPRADLIISNSEDKTIRVWDYSKRGSNALTFRREGDRFWTVAFHPELNLFAAGHDNGMIVFKLERERPPYCVSEDMLYYVKDKAIKAMSLGNSQEAVVATVDRKLVLPATMQFNAAEKAILLATTLEGPAYDLFSLQEKGITGDSKKGHGSFAVFTARNRFAVLDTVEQQIHIKSIDNSTFRSFAAPTAVDRLLPSPAGSLLMATQTNVLWFDLQQNKVISEIDVPKAKYAVWSQDMARLALMSKKTISVIDRKTFNIISSVTEPVAIKSGVWDSHGILFYTNAHHLKYYLPNGDTGIVKTIPKPLYLVRVRNDVVHAVDRDSNVQTFKIEPTEFIFKQALLERDYPKVMHIVNNCNLVGQSIIAYLRRNGYSEIALQFVKDAPTRFELALECSDLETAIEAAHKIDRAECWDKLAEEATRIGNPIIAETAYQKTNNLSKLSFLYMVTGEMEKLRQLTQQARKSGADGSVVLQNSLVLGDVGGLVGVFGDLNLTSLAYLANKTAGKDQAAHSILGSSQVDPSTVNFPPAHGRLNPLEPVHRSMEPWPLTRRISDLLSPTLAKEASLAKKKLDTIADETAAFEDQPSKEKSGSMLGLSGRGFMPPPLEEMEDGGWEIGDSDLKIDLPSHLARDDTADYTESAGHGALPAPGRPASELLSTSSVVPFNHIAAGSFESAMQLLHRQVGIVNFEPLESMFLRAVKGSHVYWTSLDDSSTSSALLYSNWDEQDARKRRAKPIFAVESLKSQLGLALQLTTSGKFTEAIKHFEWILLATLLTTVGKSGEVETVVLPLINTCREYLLGLKMEQTRKEILAGLGGKELVGEEAKRMLELACYFTHCQLQREHSILALRSALTLAYKLQAVKIAGHLARRLLELGPNEQIASQARKVLAASEKGGAEADAISIDYEELIPFCIDAQKFKPIYRGSPSASCPFCHASYQSTPDEQLTCSICRVARVGLSATGLQLCDA